MTPARHGVALLAAVAVALAACDGREEDNQKVLLEGVDPTTFAKAVPYSLLSPNTQATPRITTAFAEQVALQQNQGLAIRQTILARMFSDSSSPLLDRLVWVVNLEPAGFGGSGGPEGKATLTDFVLALVDANTGEYLFTTAAGVAVESGSSP